MSIQDRDFTVFRRRSNLVDILTPKRAGVQGYRLKAALNFDLTFITILTADIGAGFLDPVALRAGIINRLTLGTAPGQHVRIVFDPDSFGGAPPTLADENHFWLQFFPVDFAGVEGTGGARVLVLPHDEMQAAGRVIIAGTAPSGATVVNSMRLDFPVRMQNVTVRNNEVAGGDILMVATAEGGPETPVAPQETASFFEGAQASLLVRGDGAAVDFSATMTHFLPL
jgi:hypothetical protein